MSSDVETAPGQRENLEPIEHMTSQWQVSPTSMNTHQNID